MSDSESRRHFLTGLGLASLGAASLLSGCGDDDETDVGTPTTDVDAGGNDAFGDVPTGDTAPDGTADGTPDGVTDATDVPDLSLPPEDRQALTTVALNENPIGDFTLGRADVQPRTPVPTTCWQCVCRDACVAYKEGDRVVKIAGNPNALRSGGKICARGQGGVGQLYDPDRLLSCLIRSKTKAWLDGGTQPTTRRGNPDNDDPWVPITYAEAKGYLQNRLQAILDQGTGDEGDPVPTERFMYHYGRQKAMASTMNKSRLLTYLRTKTIGGHTAICESAKWTAQEMVWGKHYDTPDFDNFAPNSGDTGFILNCGTNIFETHTNHIPFSQRLRKALDRGVEMYTADVRLSNTASQSTKWLSILPGTDLALLLGVAHRLVNNHLSALDSDYVNNWCDTGKWNTLGDLDSPPSWAPNSASTGMERVAAWLNGANFHGIPYTPAWAATITGIAEDTIVEAAAKLANSNYSLVIGYRGQVCHYNGINAERAAMMINGLLGRIGQIGGISRSTEGSWSTEYSASSASQPSMGILKGGNDPYLTQSIGEDSYLAATHSASHQTFNAMMDPDGDGCPDVYLFAYYNPIYANGDCKFNIDFMGDREQIPFVVAVENTYAEGAHLADLVIADTTYLERWEYENMVSANMQKEWNIRQPVVAPLEGVKDWKDTFTEVVAALAAVPANAGKVDAPGFASAEDFIDSAFENTSFPDSFPGSSDPKTWFMENGAYYDPSAGPSYQTGQDVADDPGLGPKMGGDPVAQTAHIVFTPDGGDTNVTEYASDGDDWETIAANHGSGIFWDLWKADKEADPASTTYFTHKYGYKGYKARIVTVGTTHHLVTGFKPDKFPNTGLYDIYCGYVDHKAHDVSHGWAKEWVWPDWHPIPNHRLPFGDTIADGASTVTSVASGSATLHLTTFKHRTQTHSRTQNCKLLSENYHENPVLINAATAATIGIADGDTVKITNNDMRNAENTTAFSAYIITKAKVVQGLHPSVLAISHHCGHWKYGRYATAGGHDDGAGTQEGTDDVTLEDFAGTDPDIARMWWDAGTNGGSAGTGSTKWMDFAEGAGVHPNWIIPNWGDPVGGMQRWNDAIVTIEPVS